MKTIAILLLVCAMLIPVVSAEIPITVTDVGCTYIQWNWTPGVELTDMYIDGQLMCGYETTDPGFLLTDLHVAETHTIQILGGGDAGANTTQTSSITECMSNAGFSAQVDTPFPAELIPIPIVVAILLYRRKC